MDFGMVRVYKISVSNLCILGGQNGCMAWSVHVSALQAAIREYMRILTIYYHVSFFVRASDHVSWGCKIGIVYFTTSPDKTMKQL